MRSIGDMARGLPKDSRSKGPPFPLRRDYVADYC